MRYIVTGRVHPERADISFSRVEWRPSENGIAFASCESSQITVVLDDPSIDGWISAYVTAEHLAGIVVGALGFALGCGYSVEMIQVTEQDGSAHVFGVRPTGNAPSETLGFEPHLPAFNRALRLANKDVFFRLALRDFLLAITETVDCASYCFRAIESIKHSFVFKTGTDRWDEMHKALGTNRDLITRIIKDYADPIRHGNWINAKPTTSAQRWEMLWLTRDILAKYLDVEEPAT